MSENEPQAATAPGPEPLPSEEASPLKPIATPPEFGKKTPSPPFTTPLRHSKIPPKTVSVAAFLSGNSFGPLAGLEDSPRSSFLGLDPMSPIKSPPIISQQDEEGYQSSASASSQESISTNASVDDAAQAGMRNRKVLIKGRMIPKDSFFDRFAPPTRGNKGKEPHKEEVSAKSSFYLNDDFIDETVLIYTMSKREVVRRFKDGNWTDFPKTAPQFCGYLAKSSSQNAARAKQYWNVGRWLAGLIRLIFISDNPDKMRMIRLLSQAETHPWHDDVYHYYHRQCPPEDTSGKALFIRAVASKIAEIGYEPSPQASPA